MKGIVYCPFCESENIDKCDRLDFQIGTKYICKDCGYTFWDDEVSIKLKENGEVDDGDHTFNELIITVWFYSLLFVTKIKILLGRVGNMKMELCMRIIS